MVLKSSFTAVVLFCATYLAWGAYFSPGALVPGWNLPAIGFGGGGTLGNKQVVSWGIPLVLKGPINPPVPVGQVVPPPAPPQPAACAASCRSTVTSTVYVPTTTTTTTTQIVPTTTTQTQTETVTTPGIVPSDLAQASNDCMAMDPAAPTPMFNGNGGFQCCIPIRTMDASGTMVDMC